MQNNTFPTLFIGQNLIALSEVDSTNNYLKELLSNSEPLAEGTVIMADSQFAGRGQLNNQWISEPGKNLTFSILLKPEFLPLKKQFLLNCCISLGIINALKTFPGIGISIKWPNDIYAHERKLGGILIENLIGGTQIKHCIAGIGLNINQHNYPPNLENKAISLSEILQHDVKIPKILTQICSCIEAVYLQLKAGQYTILEEAYVKELYRLGVPGLYRQNGEVFEATLAGISETGLLRLEQQGLEKTYNFKEVEFLTP